jgi:phosphatidylglycerol:prolipoprotein diacylglycerol transferase
MAFTRIGCFLNGCCSGRPSDAWFALPLPDHHGVWQRRIPTQLMEMALALVLFGAALALRNAAPFPGAIFCLVLAGYGLGRWYLESLRDDETGGRDKTAMQATSILLVIAALAGLAFVWA